jgi:hypothetical protein
MFAPGFSPHNKDRNYQRSDSSMKKTVTLLGVQGCPTCARLYARVREALESISGEIQVEKITAPEKIMEYNAGGLPAVIVDGNLKAVRRIPEVEELITWLT